MKASGIYKTQFRLVALLIVLFGVSCLPAEGQVTFHITKTPGATPADDPLYIVGNFNNWQPGEEAYRLARLVDGTYSITLTNLPDTVIYKFTHGPAWSQVEGNEIGLQIDDRLLLTQEQPMTVALMIAGWEDIIAREQFELFVDRIPANTPTDASIYMVGNFNEWNPADEQYRLRKLPDGRFYLRLPFALSKLEYKFSRGSWETVESNEKGELLPNRLHVRKEHPSTVIHTEILGWEDLPPPNHYYVHLSKVPANTPYDAALFVTGNFNEWNPGDAAYRLQKKDDGTYYLHFSSVKDSLEFKVTRGNWSSVEGRRNGQALPNRVFIGRKAQGGNQLSLQVQSWEDLAGGYQNIYTISLLISACLCVLMILAFSSGPNAGQHRGFRYLLLLLVIMATFLIIRTLFYFREIFQALPGVILITDFIYFLYAPVFYLYMRKLIGLPEEGKLNQMLHFIPMAVMLMMYMPLFVIPKEEFIDAIINRDLHWIFATSGFLGFVLSCGYFVACIRMVMRYFKQLGNHYSSTQDSYYLQAWLGMHGLLLIAWATVLISGGIDVLIPAELSRLTELSTDFGWLIFATLVFVLVYYSVQQPQVFTQAEEATERSRPVASTLNQADTEVLKQRLSLLFEQEQPYLNSGLTLSQLAEQLQVNTHLLSKLINEGYGKNFYDFINDYRVEAFIKRAEQEANQHLTFLAIAMDVGFSSKSTFNRAFKKLTGTTPREYFRYHHDKSGNPLPYLREPAGT